MRAVALALVLCGVSAVLDGAVSARAPDAPGQRVSLDGVLSAYRGGDTGVVDRTFVHSFDFQNRLRFDAPQALERWLGPWDREKALLLIEIARTAARASHQNTAPVVAAGRRYLGAAPAGDAASAADRGFIQLWHRAAVGLLEGVSGPEHVEEHVDDVDRRTHQPTGGGPLDARLVLARAIAREQTCWIGRPSLDQPAVRVDALAKAAGVVVPDDLDESDQSKRAVVARHKACLGEALSRFEAAVAFDETRAEARVRGGWILFQDGRAAEALQWFDAAQPRDDPDLTYWLGLFRGRAFDALGRWEESASAYRSAFSLFPSAQSAGTGLALALVRLDRTAEADRVARAVRSAGAETPDPWIRYGEGDWRFVDRWMDQLRAVVR